MDDTRPTDRWIPFLGFALVAVAMAVAGLPLREPVPHLVIAVLAGALGIVTLLRSLRPERNPASWATAGFAVFALAAIMIADTYVTWSPIFPNRGGRFVYFQITARMLMIGGATLFWAAARARRDHLEDPTLARLGRIGAGIAQLGFFFAFAQELPSWGQFPGGTSGPTYSWFAIFSVLRLVYRMLLLWASIQMMRSGSDPDILRRRFSQVDLLLLGWISLMLLSAALSTGLRPGNSTTPSPLPVLWRQIVTYTAILTAVFALARRIRLLPREKALPA
jgi:hypothetical protein